MARRDDKSMISLKSTGTKSRSKRSVSGAPAAARRAVNGLLLAGPAALTSGGVMMSAGYLLRTDGSGIASLATIPGGALIIGAFALTRRPPRSQQPPPTAALARLRTAAYLLRNFGLAEDLPPASRAMAIIQTMAAGAVMVLAGYTGSGQDWALAATLAVVGGLLISGAFIPIALAASRNQPARNLDGSTTSTVR
jgi:hypothetical protein